MPQKGFSDDSCDPPHIFVAETNYSARPVSDRSTIVDIFQALAIGIYQKLKDDYNCHKRRCATHLEISNKTGNGRRLYEVKLPPDVVTWNDVEIVDLQYCLLDTIVNVQVQWHQVQAKLSHFISVQTRCMIYDLNDEEWEQAGEIDERYDEAGQEESQEEEEEEPVAIQTRARQINNHAKASNGHTQPQPGPSGMQRAGPSKAPITPAVKVDRKYERAKNSVELEDEDDNDDDDIQVVYQSEKKTK